MPPALYDLRDHGKPAAGGHQKDGSRQTFDKSKLLGSMLKACEKRTVPLATLERIADEIEQTLQNEMEREVTSSGDRRAGDGTAEGSG